MHMEIPVTDLKKAKDFYSEIFGWTVPRMKGWAMHCLIQAFHQEEASTEWIREGGCLFYIGVNDIQKKLREIEKAGGKTVRKKSEIPQMGREATFKDVFGNVLGLFKLTKK